MVGQPTQNRKEPAQQEGRTGREAKRRAVTSREGPKRRTCSHPSLLACCMLCALMQVSLCSINCGWFRPDLGCAPPKLGYVRPYLIGVDQLWAMTDQFGRVRRASSRNMWSMFGQARPPSVKLGHIWSKVGQLQPVSAKLGQQVLTKSIQVEPSLAENGQAHVLGRPFRVPETCSRKGPGAFFLAYLDPRARPNQGSKRAPTPSKRALRVAPARITF